MEEELSEGMEIHLHLGAAPFNLVINHSYCVASYNREEVEDDRVQFLESQKCVVDCNWNFLWNHPIHVLSLPSKALEHASDALVWFYTDNLISSTRSTVPFSKIECDELARVVRDMNLPGCEKSIAKTVFLAWFLREVCSYRDAESWGEHTLKESNLLRETRLATRTPETYNPSQFHLLS
ncbi:hypothetical protein CPB83DRAFT_930297 [Crepidotus variabilis]|uniref:Uncharacterized protein n=1 Tax=Crepidotus variabilis TaxID=179855 RepID=A0A9P6JUE5_9AGAR|nr:hypothetical protein CPB83DRAFT_930297 [Crepidotus variabilis]